MNGVNSFDVWALVARYATLRALLAHCAVNGLQLRQMDVETAFLNRPVSGEIHVRQPAGHERGDRNEACRLRKALYGLEQAGILVYHARQDYGSGRLQANGLYPCIYKGQAGDDDVYILVYADDLLVAAKTTGGLRQGIGGGGVGAVKARDLGPPAYTFGLHIDRRGDTAAIRLGQRQYAVSLLERFSLAAANPARLPMSTGCKLRKEGEVLPESLTQTYQELNGALLSPAKGTRPALAFAARRVAQYASALTAAHLAAAMTVLQYVKGTTEYSLRYGEKRKVMGYSDADYAGDLDTRRRTSGYLFTENGAAISFRRKAQRIVAASTAEAEYKVAAAAAKKAFWLQRLLRNLAERDGGVPVRCDNQRALTMMQQDASSQRTNYIDVAHHSLREKVNDKTLLVRYTPTTAMAANALTKPLPRASFEAGVVAMGLTAV